MSRNFSLLGSPILLAVFSLSTAMTAQNAPLPDAPSSQIQQAPATQTQFRQSTFSRDYLAELEMPQGNLFPTPALNMTRRQSIISNGVRFGNLTIGGSNSHAGFNLVPLRHHSDRVSGFGTGGRHKITLVRIVW